MSSEPITYTPVHLAEQIIATRATIEGERKQATVLFADIVDSTRLTHEMDAEEADNYLAPIIDAMRQSVFRYEGYVRPQGDGIQGLFGVPLAHEDHAVRGCCAALDMLEAISLVNEGQHPENLRPVQVRIGLNSGQVLVRSIRDDLLVDIDAIGPTVALAKRMESHALPGTVQMTAHTLGLARGFVSALSGGRISVKGFAEPVEVFQLQAVRSGSTRFHGSASSSPTRFVGRERETEALIHVWDEVIRGHGQLMAFVGEPGVGKSRLFWEFIHSDRMRDTLVLIASSLSHGKSDPYFPVINLVRQYFDVQTDRNDRRIKEKIDSKLGALDGSLLSGRTAIFDLLGLAVEDREWMQMDPVQRRHTTLDSITRILLREARDRPLCLVFENLHWIDSETQALLDRIVEALPLSPIMLLVNYRPEYDSHWTKKTYFTQLPLASLPKASAHELLNALLGTHSDLMPLKEKLVELTQGNPFFLEESIQTLREQNILSGERGDARLMQPITKIDVPASVQSTLEARIDRLDPDQKHILHYASVLGKIVPIAVLREAIGRPEKTLRSGLQHLQSSEFLYVTRLYPETEYKFKHALTYQVAYRTLPRKRRRSMHAKVMRAMEEVVADRRAEHVERLAHHAFLGGVWDKAVRYSFEAGKKCFDRSANSETVTYLDRALEALHKLSDNEENLTLAVEIRLVLRLALLNLGEVDRIGQLLEEARALVGSVNNPEQKGQFEAFLSNHYCVTGNQAKALEHGLQAQEIAKKNDNFNLQVEMAYRLGQPLYHLAQYRDAIDVLERAIALLGPGRQLDRLGMGPLPAVVCRTWLCHCCAELGEFATGTSRALESVELAGQADHPLTTVFAQWGLGGVQLRKRDYAGAIVAYEKGLDVCKRWSLHVWFPRLASSAAIARALSGHTEGAITLIEEALEAAQSMQFKVDEPRLFERLAAVHRMNRQYETAEKEARKSLGLSIERDAKGHQAWALRQLGEIFSSTDRPDWSKTLEHYQAALNLAVTLGMRPFSALCYEGIGRVHEECGRQAEADAANESASAILRELEEPYFGSAAAS